MPNNFFVSIIIPFKDQSELLDKCVKSIIYHSSYSNYEIVCVNNNSEEKKTDFVISNLNYLDSRIRVISNPIPFNFSKINNDAVVKNTSGNFIVFLNNDVEIISEDWIQKLMYWGKLPNVGCVGARLYYANNTVQHAGVILNNRGNPIHRNHKISRFSDLNKKDKTGKVLAVTAALCLIEKSKFLEIGGFNEGFSVSYNDIDLCWRLHEKNYQTIYMHECEAYHYESVTRGYEDTEPKKMRLAFEQKLLRNQHPLIYSGHPDNKRRTLKRVLFISETSRLNRTYLDPSVRYRCFNAAFELRSLGYIADIISYKAFELNLINRYDVFIFHRPVWGTKLKKIVKKLEITDKCAFASYDDLIFGSEFALESSLYKRGETEKKDVIRLFDNNLKAMSLFKKIIVSTSELAKRVKSLSDAEVVISHNALTLRDLSRAKLLNTAYRGEGSKRKIITYLSGTKSHDNDFKFIIEPLSELLNKYNGDIELHIVGPLSYDEKKIKAKKFLDVQYHKLSQIASRAYLNIAPLEINPFTMCKSGLKFFESGLVKVPSLVSPIPDMLRFSDSGGLSFAKNPDDWYREISRLVENESLRDQKAALSYNYTIKNCTMSNEISAYIDVFNRLEG